MASDVRRRVELVEDLAPTVGRETAVRLVDEIPLLPDDIAIRGDIEGLEQRIDDRATALRDELLAAFRGELVTAVSGQTRQVIIATATAAFGIGGLAVTLAQVL